MQRQAVNLAAPVHSKQGLHREVTEQMTALDAQTQEQYSNSETECIQRMLQLATRMA